MWIPHSDTTVCKFGYGFCWPFSHFIYFIFSVSKKTNHSCPVLYLGKRKEKEKKRAFSPVTRQANRSNVQAGRQSMIYPAACSSRREEDRLTDQSQTTIPTYSNSLLRYSPPKRRALLKYIPNLVERRVILRSFNQGD